MCTYTHLHAHIHLGMGIFGNFLFRSLIGFKKKLLSTLGACAGHEYQGMAVMEIMKISEDCYENEC